MALSSTSTKQRSASRLVTGSSGYSQTCNKLCTSTTKREKQTFFTHCFNNFAGVLVSDFYPAYEGIQCSQQKCLIHLIRDLNDDLLKHPFDEELKWLARAFAELLRPMVQTIDRHGLRSRFLKQHLSAVEKFYQRLRKFVPRSEVASKSKQRFEKNRDTLFTFLKHDGVPWNNNNAEHAIKAFAALRQVIKGVTSEAGLRDYLVLLSICETCNYQGLDFLDFLRSGETDIANFTENSRGRSRRSWLLGNSGAEKRFKRPGW